MLRLSPFSPLLVAGALCAGCVSRAVTPPGRALAITSPLGLEPGKTDVGGTAHHIGSTWGPQLIGGDVRIRHAISPNFVAEGDVGGLRVTNSGEGGPRWGGTTRAGLQWRPLGDRKDVAALAISTGVGGGTAPAAGTWANADVGVSFANRHRWFRPILSGTLGVSSPIRRKQFTVRDIDDEVVSLELPTNLTLQGSVALELGPIERTLILGATVSQFWLKESSRVLDPPGIDDDLYLSLGVGARFEL